MRFLTDANILEQVRGLASRSGKLMAAVAYWGKDAAQRTGLAEHPNPAEVRVICDLLSGACNPNEIEELTRIGVQVRTLDRLHAKVWISGHDVIVGSANASHNGLPGDDQEAANASIEAAVLSHDPCLAREVTTWFEKLWCKSKEIEPHLDHARQLWNRRRRGGGRGFTTPLAEIICDAGEHDRFAGLRLLAYCHHEPDQEAIDHMEQNFGLHYSDDEWQEFGHEHPWYEWAPGDPVWDHPPGTVFADFSCGTQGGTFDFNGYWQLRDCPTIELESTRLSLLTRLPDFNGAAFSPEEAQALARRIREVVRANNHETDDFGSYIDQELGQFLAANRSELCRLILVEHVVEAARMLCRSGKFSPSLTLDAIRECKRKPDWLAGYARVVGDNIYANRNSLKLLINPHFGRRVKSGVGAKDRTDQNGKPIRAKVTNEIIQSYTLFQDYDRQTVGP